jgi:hypothetical protein
MAWPPEAIASFTTTNGENRLWLDRLSSSTIRAGPSQQIPLDELLELLLEDELLLEEELLEDDEELLLDEELEELELLDELEELLLEDELELDEELELLLEVPLLSLQVGNARVPS